MTEGVFDHIKIEGENVSVRYKDQEVDKFGITEAILNEVENRGYTRETEAPDPGAEDVNTE